MKRFAALALAAALLLSVPGPCAGEDECFQILSEDDLVCRSEYCPGTFDAGGGVRFRMSPGLSERKLMGPPVTWMSIAVLDGDAPVRDLPDSFYIGYALLAQGDARYWMILRAHYRLTPSSLSVDNLPFRGRYLAEAKIVEAEIHEAVSKRTSRPATLLLGKDQGEFFSDETGQLLVKRTLLYLYARQDKTAWQTLERDARKLYRQDRGLKQIRNEIRKILAEGPY